MGESLLYALLHIGVTQHLGRLKQRPFGVTQSRRYAFFLGGLLGLAIALLLDAGGMLSADSEHVVENIAQMRPCGARKRPTPRRIVHCLLLIEGCHRLGGLLDRFLDPRSARLICHQRKALLVGIFVEYLLRLVANSDARFVQCELHLSRLQVVIIMGKESAPTGGDDHTGQGYLVDQTRVRECCGGYSAGSTSTPVSSSMFSVTRGGSLCQKPESRCQTSPSSVRANSRYSSQAI